jgi:uncharacterized membrane protein YbhN (UPF0104 family)
MVTSTAETGSRQSVLRILGTLVAVGLLAYLLSRQGWTEIAGALWRIPLQHLALVAGFTALSRLCIAARWYSLLRAGEPDISFGASLRLTFAGLFASNFLPTSIGGDVVRIAGTLRLAKDPVGSTASVVADRLVGLAGMLLMVPLSLPALLTWLRSTAWMSAGWGSLALAAHPSGWARWQGRLRRMPTRIREALSIWVRRPKALLTALVFTWLHMTLLFGNITILLTDMGETLSFASVAGLWSLTYLLALMPFSINGLGLRELSLTFIFTSMGRISVESGLALGLLLRSFDVLATLPGAIFLPSVVVGRPRPEAGR